MCQWYHMWPTIRIHATFSQVTTGFIQVISHTVCSNYCSRPALRSWETPFCNKMNVHYSMWEEQHNRVTPFNPSSPLWCPPGRWNICWAAVFSLEGWDEGMPGQGCLGGRSRKEGLCRRLSWSVAQAAPPSRPGRGSPPGKTGIPRHQSVAAWSVWGQRWYPGYLQSSYSPLPAPSLWGSKDEFVKVPWNHSMDVGSKWPCTDSKSHIKLAFCGPIGLFDNILSLDQRVFPLMRCWSFH